MVESEADLRSKVGSKVTKGANSSLAGKNGSKKSNPKSQDSSKILEEKFGKDVRESPILPRNEFPANSDAQDSKEDIEMDDLLDALSDVDRASEERKEEDLSVGPKVNKYGRPIYPKLAKEIE